MSAQTEAERQPWNLEEIVKPTNSISKLIRLIIWARGQAVDFYARQCSVNQSDRVQADRLR